MSAPNPNWQRCVDEAPRALSRPGWRHQRRPRLRQHAGSSSSSSTGSSSFAEYATDLGYLMIVVTNQAGIGRGYYSEREFLALTEWMCAAFRDRGAPIAKVYYCPFHPEHGVGELQASNPPSANRARA